MFAITSRNVRYQVVGITMFQYVKSFHFGEMGWSVKFTKDASEAKTYKTYKGAYNAARKLGISYDVVRF